jgi:hypothetical protein
VIKCIFYHELKGKGNNHKEFGTDFMEEGEARWRLFCTISEVHAGTVTFGHATLNLGLSAGVSKSEGILDKSTANNTNNGDHCY